MRILIINLLLSLATKHANINQALIARGDTGLCVVHMAIKDIGEQELGVVPDRKEFQQLLDEPALANIRVLGIYTMPQAAWSLGIGLEKTEKMLANEKKVDLQHLKPFSDQLMERLIMSSTHLDGTKDEMPEGHELWRLCLTGIEQVVYVLPPDGGVSILPGTVLADFSAPRGLASSIAEILFREEERMQRNIEVIQKWQQDIEMIAEGHLSRLMSMDPRENPGPHSSLGHN